MARSDAEGGAKDALGVTDEEFEAFLDDASKTIDADLEWLEDEDHSPALEFRAELATSAGYPVSVRGSFNRAAGTLSFVIIHRSVGRIYALDVGKAHRNPGGEMVGETHKHRWTEQFGDKQAYEPPDISAGADDPLGAWRQFCEEARITHRGKLHPPPFRQEELF